MNNKTKLITLLFACTLSLATSFSAHASRTVHSGTNCEAANQAQANLMTWSKDGLTNNSANDLYVICPIDVDAWHWDSTPQLEVGVSVWMPPGYGSRHAQGPFCAVRIMWSSQLFGSNTSGSFSPLLNVSNNIGTFNPTGFLIGQLPIATNGDDAYEEMTTPIPGAAALLDDAESADLFSAHLLCLLPKNGGRIISYKGYQR